MAKDQDEEIDDADIDQEDNSDEEEDTDESDSEDEDEGEEDEGAEDEDDDDSSDSDDDAALPKTRKELNDAIAKGVREALKSKKNRDGADRRTSKKGPLPNGKRSAKAADPRVDAHDAAIAEMRAAEAKRQYGYENNLAPDEVDVVFRLNKKPTAKTLRDPIVKGALTGYREAKRLKGNLPSGNARVVPVGSKDYSKMSPADKSKHFVSRRQQILEQKRGRGGSGN